MIGDNIIKNDIEYKILKEATAISVSILKKIRDETKIGVNASYLDQLAGELCVENGVKPSFYGVRGVKGPYVHNICISTNDEILHAIPKEERIFKSGDIVKLDFGIVHKGFYTDHCVTVGLGTLNEDETRLMETGKFCIDTAVKQAVKGNSVGDISNALQSVADLAGFNYVTTYVGHGIGRSLHLSPEIPSYGVKGSGAKLQKGMILCIENQITLGSAALKMDEDGWTLKTKDGSKGIMFEHMVLITDSEPEILTLLD